MYNAVIIKANTYYIVNKTNIIDNTQCWQYLQSSVKSREQHNVLIVIFIQCMNEHTIKLSNMYIGYLKQQSYVVKTIAAINANSDIYLNCVVALDYITALSYMTPCC